MVTRRADRTSGGPLQLEQQERLIAHSPRSAQDRLDRRVDGFDDTESDGMIAVGGDAVEVAHEQIAQLLHLGQPLPAHGLEPPEQKAGDPLARRVAPEAIELLAQDVGLEEPAIGGEQLLELARLGAAHGLPAPRQQPPLAPPVGPHDRPGAEELLGRDPRRARGGSQRVSTVRGGGSSRRRGHRGRDENSRSPSVESPLAPAKGNLERRGRSGLLDDHVRFVGKMRG